MKKSFLVASLFAFVAVSTAVMAPSKSEAIPAFARQVGMACSSCHFQHFPKLNSFGRAFKLGGMTDVGSQELIEDDNLSIPVVLNMAMVTKVRYQKVSPNVNPAAGTAKTGTSRGELQFPDEAALWAAGRMGEHMGAAFELGGQASGNTNSLMRSGKFVFSMPVSFGKAGVSLYTTDGLGPAFGMELFNTGVVRNVRGFEQRTHVYASQAAAYQGGATGLTAFAGGDLFFAALGLHAPDGSNNSFDVGTDLSYNYRLAFTPNFAGFDLMIGLFGAGGETVLTGTTGNVQAAYTVTRANTLVYVNSEIFGIDLQAQGEVAGMTLEVTGQYVTSGHNIAGDTQGQQIATNGTASTNTTGSGSTYNNGDGWNIAAELGVLHNAGIQLAYLDWDANLANGGSTKIGDFSATTLGAYYELLQNVELMVNYTWKSGNGTTGTNGRNNKNELIVLFETAF